MIRNPPLIESVKGELAEYRYGVGDSYGTLGKQRHQTDYVCRIGYTLRRKNDGYSATVNSVALDDVVIYAPPYYANGQGVAGIEAGWIAACEAWLKSELQVECDVFGDLFEVICKAHGV